MRLHRPLFLLVVVGCLTAPAMAQGSAKVVKVRPGESVYKVKKGSSVKVSIVIEIDSGYHINSNRPREAFLIPTSLKFERAAGLAATAIVYPKAKLQKFDFSEKPMSVYEGKAVLTFTARALPTLAPGSHTLRAKLKVQACDNEKCLRPDTVDVNIPLEVTM